MPDDINISNLNHFTGIRYRFSADVDMDEVPEVLRMSLLAAEGMFGTVRVELGVLCRTNRGHRYCDVVAEPEIGRMLYGVFLAFLRTTLGETSVQVRWLRRRPRPGRGTPPVNGGGQ